MGELAKRLFAHNLVEMFIADTFRSNGHQATETTTAVEDPPRDPAANGVPNAEDDALAHTSPSADPDTSIEAVNNQAATQNSAVIVEDLHDTATSEPTQETDVNNEVARENVSVWASFDPPKILYIKEATQLERVLPELLSAPTIGLDTETTGLDPFVDKLRTVQIATPEHTVVVDVFHCPVEILAPLMAGDRWLIGHNLKFDLKFLVKAGSPWPSVRCLDTMLSAQVLGASTTYAPKGTYSLDGTAKHFLNISLNKSLQQSDWGLELSPEQIRYAAMDAAILLPLATTLRAKLKEARLWKIATLEAACLRALAWMELAGMPVDVGQWRTQATFHTQRKVELIAELSALAGREINWNSNPQILSLLQARGLDVTSTNREALLPFITDEVVAKLFEYRRAANRAQTYGEGWLDNVHTASGRVHADYRQLGSTAGRMSCEKPNLQNVPRELTYRALFRVPDGRTIVKADYSQIELRLAAIIGPDEMMLQAYRANEDLHTKTAAELLGVPINQVAKEHRQLAKAVNFGLLYGMGATRLQEYAWEVYSVRLSEAEAYQHRARWFELYAGIRNWHDRVGGQVNGRRAIETRTLYGRRRLGVNYLPDALNSPVQGSGADGLKRALVRLFESRDDVAHTRLINVVHDEILAECPREEAEATAMWLKTHMEAAMQEVVNGKVPTPVEVTISQSWAG